MASNIKKLHFPTEGKGSDGQAKTFWKTCGRAIDRGEDIMLVFDSYPANTNRVFIFKREEPEKDQLTLKDSKEDKKDEEQKDFVSADKIGDNQ